MFLAEPVSNTRVPHKSYNLFCLTAITITLALSYRAVSPLWSTLMAVAIFMSLHLNILTNTDLPFDICFSRKASKHYTSTHWHRSHLFVMWHMSKVSWCWCFRLTTRSLHSQDLLQATVAWSPSDYHSLTHKKKYCCVRLNSLTSLIISTCFKLILCDPSCPLWPSNIKEVSDKKKKHIEVLELGQYFPHLNQ